MIVPVDSVAVGAFVCWVAAPNAGNGFEAAGVAPNDNVGAAPSVGVVPSDAATPSGGAAAPNDGVAVPNEGAAEPNDGADVVAACAPNERVELVVAGVPNDSELLTAGVAPVKFYFHQYLIPSILVSI